RLFGNLNVQELPGGLSAQFGVAAISDRNFFEQYFPTDFSNSLDQETFAYVKMQNGIWAGTLLAEGDFQRWMTHTEWLPKADGYILGASLFDLFTYNVHGSAGYGQLRPTTVVPFAYSPTDVRVDDGRFDLWQDLALPLNLGPFKIVPYLAMDLTYY